MVKCAQFERMYEPKSGSKIPEDIRMGVLQHKLAPMGVRESLVRNAERFTSYRQMKDSIEEWIANGGENQFAAPMDIGAFIKGDKGKGKGKGKDKDRGGQGLATDSSLRAAAVVAELEVVLPPAVDSRKRRQRQR